MAKQKVFITRKIPEIGIKLLKKNFIVKVYPKNKPITRKELFKSVKPQLDIEELEETGELVAFERGWDFISQCDGKNSLLNIADYLNVPAWDLYDLVDKLDDLNLIAAHE